MSSSAVVASVWLHQDLQVELSLETYEVHPITGHILVKLVRVSGGAFTDDAWNVNSGCLSQCS